MISYTVSVTTGDRRGAGTDANVYVKVIGTKGHSGDRLLESPGNNFERGKTDVFGIDCVDLGDIQKYVISLLPPYLFQHFLLLYLSFRFYFFLSLHSRLQIWHDNSGVGPGWFLDKVVIKSGKGEEWYFPCGKWLADDEDDKLIRREIAAEKKDVGDTYSPLIKYRVEVITGDRPGAGTDAKVFIELFGEKPTLKTGDNFLENGMNNFERNHTDVFGVESPDLGKLTVCLYLSSPSTLSSLS